MRIGQTWCNCSCFEIDEEMDAILLIIDIIYHKIQISRFYLSPVRSAAYGKFPKPIILLVKIVAKMPL